MPRLNTSKLAAVILATLALGWAAVLFIGLPAVYSRKVEALVGHPRETVERELGLPTRTWEPEEFACDPRLPCEGTALGGPVFLYAEAHQGWYLYFDQAGTLRAAKRSVERM